jgi:hypothetical protein
VLGAAQEDKSRHHGAAGFKLTARSEQAVRISSFLHILFGGSNR